MKCKICKSKDLDKLQLEEIYYHCQNCDLIFIDEEEIIDPEDERKRYEQHNNNHENTGYVKMFQQFIEKVIDPYTNEIEKVLDFGCGPRPVLADLLTEQSFSVDIYDLYFFPEEVFKGKEYDIITSTEVFEHLKDPLKEIEKLIMHLKKGGYLAIMTVFHPGINKFTDWWYKRDLTHITFYNNNTFKEIAEMYSLEIVFEDGDKYCLFKKHKEVIFKNKNCMFLNQGKKFP